jgi:hypothetical protein
VRPPCSRAPPWSVPSSQDGRKVGDKTLPSLQMVVGDLVQTVAYVFNLPVTGPEAIQKWRPLADFVLGNCSLAARERTQSHQPGTRGGVTSNTAVEMHGGLDPSTLGPAAHCPTNVTYSTSLYKLMKSTAFSDHQAFVLHAAPQLGRKMKWRQP